MQSTEEPSLFSRAGPLATSPSKVARFTCLCCRAKFETVVEQKAHFRTEWHTYNLKRKVCHLEPIDLESFQKIQTSNQPGVVGAGARVDSSQPLAHQTRLLSQPGVAQDHAQASRVQAETSNEDEWRDIDEVDGETLPDEDYTDEEVQEMLANVVQDDTCLFCNFKSANRKRNVEHMDSMHGFFIPEDRYLIDLEGLLEYLGFKVGAGCTCLWCDKQFSSLHGVRLHMLYKQHCKINYDQERASEFKEFYDYTGQEQIPMKPLNELALSLSRKARPSSGRGGALVGKLNALSSGKSQLVKANQFVSKVAKVEQKRLKKFNAERVKRLLRAQFANNNTMRGRIRLQNPM